jgi:hypothetical protein
MKQVINIEESPTVEFFKRALYSFQVLMVGIALPLLFCIGISDGNQKKPADTETTGITTIAQQPVNHTVAFHINGL